MSRLELFLLGPPRIRRDGAAVEVDTHKALAGGGLVADRETVGLDWNGGLWVDLVQFRSYLNDRLAHGHPAADVCGDCPTPLAEAVELCRDDFMAGFTLRDSPGFDDWQVLQTEGLRRDLSSALDLLARCQVNQGQLESAIAHTRRRLALDAMDESVHRRLMQLLAWLGQRAGLPCASSRECVRVLDRELGVPPLEGDDRAIPGHKGRPGLACAGRTAPPRRRARRERRFRARSFLCDEAVRLPDGRAGRRVEDDAADSRRYCR